MNLFLFLLLMTIHPVTAGGFAPLPVNVSERIVEPEPIVVNVQKKIEKPQKEQQEEKKNKEKKPKKTNDYCKYDDQRRLEKVGINCFCGIPYPDSYEKYKSCMIRSGQEDKIFPPSGQ